MVEAMDAAMFWLALISALAAVSAAVFAFVQAKAATDALKEAREAEAGAIAARDAAVQAHRDTAANSGRIAEVLEQQAAEDRAAAALRPNPWMIRSGSARKTGKAVMLHNMSDLAVDEVSIELDPMPYMLHLTPNPAPTSFLPGEAVEIYRAGGAGGRITTLIIRWRWSDSDEMITTRETLN